MTTHQRTRISGLLLSAVAAVVAIAPRGGAQATQPTTQNLRWQAWFGCWRGSDVQPSENGPFVCVRPTAEPSAVEVAVVDSGRVTNRDTLDASGAERPVDKQGCKGTQRGDWSADTYRVFLHAKLECEGGLSRTSNTIVGITPTGEWLNVQSVTAFGTTVVRSVHYTDANDAKGLPAEFSSAAAERAGAISTARVAASGALTVPSVREAVVRTDTAAVQAWIAQRGVRFNLDAGKLVQLADAGVPSSVIDVMIGVSYPEHFALNSTQLGAPSASDLGDANMGGLYGDRSRADCLARMTTLFLPLMYDPCMDFYGRLGYDRFGYDDYLYRYGYGFSPLFGYGYGYGYNPYLGGYYSAPVVIVRGSDEPHGRVVNGRGYTRGSATASGGSSRSTGRSSSASSGSSSASSSGSSSSGSSSTGSSSAGASSSGSSSSGSSGGGRTAHPRPPR